MAHLPGIKTPADIMLLSDEEMLELTAEVREKIIEVVSTNGGHLSPNLGVVELTIALYRVFNFERDKIVWDVGHQSYTHKLLTGRFDRFHTLRQEGGIAGFPRRSESKYDHFDAGHAGTSISAALGFASARDLAGLDHEVVAVIGDGSLTSGLSFEGLNNAGDSDTDLVVILNDNEMSISPNVGALSAHLNRIISGKLYNKVRGDLDQILNKIPRVGEQVTALVQRIEEAAKGVLVPGRLFEDFGFKYFGPLDGHDLPLLLEAFESVKKLKGPRIIHVVTKKGKGYKPAEEHPDAFHGTPPFVIASGKKKKVPGKATFTSVFGASILELAAQDDKVVVIAAAMVDGTGLKGFAKKYPKRLFDVGIAEQHAVTFAGALAAEGYKPVVAVYSTFMQRAYDQVLHDVCNMNLPVTFALDRGGIVGDDGSTHQGVFDLSFLSSIPNMCVMAPKDENELRHMVYTAVNHNGPCAFRFPRGEGLGVEMDAEFKMLETGKGELLREGNDLLLCAIGNRVPEAMTAAEQLETDGFSVAVINARFAKPLDMELIGKWADHCGRIITVEENALIGGFGSMVFDQLRQMGLGTLSGEALGIPDIFVEHASQARSRHKCGIDAEGIVCEAKEVMKKRSDLITWLYRKKEAKQSI